MHIKSGDQDFKSVGARWCRRSVPRRACARVLYAQRSQDLAGFVFLVLSQGAQGGTATGRPLKDFKLNTQGCTLQGFNQVLFLPYRFEPSCEFGLCVLLLSLEICAFLTSARIKFLWQRWLFYSPLLPKATDGSSNAAFWYVLARHGWITWSGHRHFTRIDG